MKTYLQKLNEFVVELNKQTGFKNFFFQMNKELTTAEISDIEEQYQVTLSANIRKFYSISNGFKFGWEFHNEELDKMNHFVEGYAHLLELQKVLGGFDGRLWRNELWNENTSKTIISFYKRLKVIDYFGKDNIHCICAELSEKSILTDKLWIYRLGYEPIPLKMSFESYIKNLYLTKAFWGWQYLYLQDESALKTNSDVEDEIILLVNHISEIVNEDMIRKINKSIKTR